MAKLTEPQQLFIVRALACYDTPSRVVEAVKEEFGLSLARQQVAIYDPTKGANASKTSPKLRTIFDEVRKEFLADVCSVPRANLAVRLRALDRMSERAEASGNYMLAADLLEQIAKEVGGMFTNRREAQGAEAAPPISAPQGLDFFYGGSAGEAAH